MWRRRLVTLLAVASVAACGLNFIGTLDSEPVDDPNAAPPGDERSQGGDDGVDAAEPGEPDAGPREDADASVLADATVDAAVDAPMDVTPPPTWNCNNTLVTSCAACPGRPLRCVMCATQGAGQWRVCVPPGSSCYANYRPAGYTWCRCNPPDASTCILPEQGCNPYDNGVCVTCGETQTSGDPCKGGGTCNQGARACQ